MVLDGNSIINRAYYGIRPLTNREGLYTHAVFGFLTTLLRLKEEEQPDDLAEQLSRINEQLAIKSRRARRVWKAIAFIVGGVIAVYVLILILATVFSFSPDQSGAVAGRSQSVETIVEKAENRTLS